MGVRKFQGKGAGMGLWLGCGFGAGAERLARLLQLRATGRMGPAAAAMRHAFTLAPSKHPAAGWGFGGTPLGFAGLSAGGMCGVVAGLGWGVGVGMGTQYINVSPEFTEGKAHRCAARRSVRVRWPSEQVSCVRVPAAWGVLRFLRAQPPAACSCRARRPAATPTLPCIPARPGVLKQVQYVFKRLTTLQSTPAGASSAGGHH